MNKRQYKKYIKKLGCRSYREYRLKKLLEPIKDIDLDNNKFNIVYITDSKRGNLKHVHHVRLLVNCIPISCKTSCETVSFSQDNYIENDLFEQYISF